jgi:hypothetical protein
VRYCGKAFSQGFCIVSYCDEAFSVVRDSGKVLLVRDSGKIF